MVGGLLSLLWCLILLSVSLGRTTPPTSLFPEIDFASKLGSEETNQEGHSLREVISSLNMAQTFEICRELAPMKVHLRMDSVGQDFGQGGARSAKCEIVDGD